MFSFSERIRELTIKFICLLEFRLGDPTSIPLFLKEGYIWCLFLTIGVPIQVTGISLNITNQVIHVEAMLLPKISFDSLL